MVALWVVLLAGAAGAALVAKGAQTVRANSAPYSLQGGQSGYVGWGNGSAVTQYRYMAAHQW